MSDLPMTQAEYDGKTKYERGKSKSYQYLYDHRWRKYRKTFLLKNPLCIKCLELGKTTPAKIVDHRKPHKGSVKIFWDRSNHDGLCKPCHDIKTQSEGAFGR